MTNNIYESLSHSWIGNSSIGFLLLSDDVYGVANDDENGFNDEEDEDHGEEGRADDSLWTGRVSDGRDQDSAQRPQGRGVDDENISGVAIVDEAVQEEVGD